MPCVWRCRKKDVNIFSQKSISNVITTSLRDGGWVNDPSVNGNGPCPLASYLLHSDGSYQLSYFAKRWSVSELIGLKASVQLPSIIWWRATLADCRLSSKRRQRCSMAASSHLRGQHIRLKRGLRLPARLRYLGGRAHAEKSNMKLRAEHTSIDASRWRSELRRADSGRRGRPLVLPPG